MIAEAQIQELLDREAIREILYQYCRAIDRADSELLASLFTPEAKINYGMFSGSVEEFCEFARSYVDVIGPTHHNLTNPMIRVSGDCATSESYGIAMHGDFGSDGGPVDYVVYCRYEDRWERRDGTWKIASRLVVYDWNQNLPRTAIWGDGPRSGLEPRGKRGKEDVSYSKQ